MFLPDLKTCQLALIATITFQNMYLLSRSSFLHKTNTFYQAYLPVNMAMNNITSVLYRRRLCINKINKIKPTQSTNYMKKYQFHQFISSTFSFALICQESFKLLSLLLFSRLLFFHSSGLRNQTEALLLLSFFNILNKFILYISLVFLSWSQLACTSFISRFKMILATSFLSAFADSAREV